MPNVINLKVLFISRASGSGRGGMERLHSEMVGALTAHTNIAPTVLAYHGNRLGIPFWMILSLPTFIAAARTADFIHLGDPLISLIGWTIKKVTKKPVAVTVHGLDVTYPNPIYQLYLKLFFRRFNGYFAISSYAKSLLEKWHLSGTQIILTPGMSDNYYSPQTNRSELLKMLGDEPGKTYLLTVGRLVKRKGHTWFIRNVLPQLPSSTTYLIAGEGAENTAIQKTITEKKLEHRVKLLGRVTDHDLKVLYNTVDAFIQPNIKVEGDTEGFGLVLLEAAACGRPVFAANLEGIPDAINHNRNGVLLPHENEKTWIAELNNFLTQLKFPIPRSEIRSYTLQNFSWDTVIKKYQDAFIDASTRK